MIDGFLVAVTVASLTMAATMSVIAWRALRLNRRQHTEPTVPTSCASWQTEESSTEQEWAAMSPGAHATGTPDDGFGRLASPATSTGDEHASRSDVETGRSDARRSAVHAEAPARGTRRLAVASGSVALVVMVAVGSAVVMGGQQRPVAPESKQAAGAGSSLELMSLDSARDGDRVTIRGLVKNPLTGHRVDGLQAVAFLFDRRGQYIGATSAVVAQGALAPGAESPFEVPLAAGGLQVGRYRLSFRVADTPVPHVDRRSDVAGNPEPAR